jgi:hypothetical protein
MYNSIIFLVVLYERETCALKLRIDHELRMFENRVLRKTCEPKTDEVIGDWRKLINEEVRNLCSSQNTVKMMKSRRLR